MADFQNAGYRLLSFKYTPPPAVETKRAAKKEKRVKEVDDETGTGGVAGDLPSLSSLLASLQEIQSSSKDGKDMDGPGEEMSGESNDSTASVSIARPLTHFHLFNDLPTETRLKIWGLTFLPRAVEVRPPRPAYDFKGQVSTNPGHDIKDHSPSLILSYSIEHLSLMYLINFSGNLAAATPPNSQSPSKRAKQPLRTTVSPCR